MRGRTIDLIVLIAIGVVIWGTSTWVGSQLQLGPRLSLLFVMAVAALVIWVVVFVELLARYWTSRRFKQLIGVGFDPTFRTQARFFSQRITVGMTPADVRSEMQGAIGVDAEEAQGRKVETYTFRNGLLGRPRLEIWYDHKETVEELLVL